MCDKTVGRHVGETPRWNRDRLGHPRSPNPLVAGAWWLNVQSGQCKALMVCELTNLTGRALPREKENTERMNSRNPWAISLCLNAVKHVLSRGGETDTITNLRFRRGRVWCGLSWPESV